MIASISAMRRQVAKLREEVRQLRGNAPPPGMVAVRDPGVSGLLRQAREHAVRDEHGNRVPRRVISINDPRPPNGVAAMLWDTKKRRAERQAAGDLALTDASEDP